MDAVGGRYLYDGCHVARFGVEVAYKFYDACACGVHASACIVAVEGVVPAVGNRCRHSAIGSRRHVARHG